MKNEFLKKATAHIKPEERALMVKSLEVLARIHEILDRKNISQKNLADNLQISAAAVSKMLNAGGNLGLNTIVRLELILGEPILMTPKKFREREARRIDFTHSVVTYEKLDFLEGESGKYITYPLTMDVFNLEN